MTAESLLAWATPVATIGLLAVTVAYSYFTFELARIGKMQRFEAVRPRIHVSVIAEQKGNFFVLRIENVGMSPAKNFRASLDKIVCRQYGDREPINDMPFFQNGLPAFLPHTPMEVGLGVSHTYLAPEVDRSLHPKNFTVTCEYSFEKRAIREVFPVEIFDLYSETKVRRTDVDDLATALKNEIGRPLEEVAKALRLRI